MRLPIKCYIPGESAAKNGGGEAAEQAVQPDFVSIKLFLSQVLDFPSQVLDLHSQVSGLRS